MTTGWMKSLQCKSKVMDDVVRHHHRRRHSNPKSYSHPLSNSSSCKSSVQSLKDVVETSSRQSRPNKEKPPKPHPVSRKSEPGPKLPATIRTRFTGAAGSLFPSLAELPEGHPSRNVVEIIFRSSWGEKDFSGQVEMVFKVQNLTWTVSRFEEYREAVKARARGGGGADHARCVADGNEVMRFYCLGATTGGGPYETSGGAWGFHGSKGAAVCTFSWSGVAHENAGGGRGRRAMLVCRVIAGQVCQKYGFDPFVEGRIGHDSVNGEKGELWVFDARALLPCFLIIYNKL